ncbi:MAG: outer membrane lipoprotein carrier protein LolA [Bacteroidia bacterium]|nr:outer membrane lipoprotein carrier protein LolA [Bacteroidia bacterium]
MKKIWNLPVVFLIGTFLIGAGFRTAPVEDANQILRESKAKLESLQDLSAKFSYEISNPAMRAVRKDGNVIYKGGKFVVKLNDMQVYCDGETQWFFLPEVNEVTVQDYDPEDEFSIEYIFRVYQAAARARYDGTDQIHGATCHKIFLAVTDPALDYHQAHVWINTTTKLLEKVALVDKKQTKTTYEFSNIEVNKGLNNEIFKFKSSDHPGVDIYDERMN